MPRIKSIILGVKIDKAQRAHNCQANAHHRILRKDMRLNVRNGRGWDRYCLNCAKLIVQRGIAELKLLERDLNAPSPVSDSDAQHSITQQIPGVLS